jgi:hypothetical protein
MTGRLQEDQGAPRGEPGKEGVRTFFFLFFSGFLLLLFFAHPPFIAIFKKIKNQNC